jgi:hypothetical protein
LIPFHDYATDIDFLEFEIGLHILESKVEDGYVKASLSEGNRTVVLYFRGFETNLEATMLVDGQECAMINVEGLQDMKWLADADGERLILTHRLKEAKQKVEIWKKPLLRIEFVSLVV